MKRWTIPELIEAQQFGIMNEIPYSDSELEQVKTVEYEFDPENDNPMAWLRTENYRQKFRLSPLLTVIRVFKGVPLYLGPPSGPNKSHLLILTTSYKTYGALTGIKEKEAMP